LSTLARTGGQIKHLFEGHAGKCSILSVVSGRHSHSSSIERLFDHETGSEQATDQGQPTEEGV
jgi:hypothetical protein